MDVGSLKILFKNTCLYTVLLKAVRTPSGHRPEPYNDRLIRRENAGESDYS